MPLVSPREPLLVERKSGRRSVCLGIGSAAVLAAVPTFAQPSRTVRIGILSTGVAITTPTNAAFLRRMEELGYVEGRNVIYEWRLAEGRYERFPEFARDLVARKVDVIVAGGTPAIPAAMAATRTIPIVMATSTDPVANGFVASLARPGGNITGLSNISADLGGKHLELLANLLPKLSRVAVLMDPRIVSHPLVLKNVEATAAKLSVRTMSAQATTPEEFERAFDAMKRERADAAIVGLSGLFIVHGKQIAALAIRQGLPMIFPSSQSVEAGGLISYGQDLADSYRRTAEYVDRILKGSKPGDLPVEQAAKIEMVINLVTARSLGLKIPQSVLFRADRVIDQPDTEKKR